MPLEDDFPGEGEGPSGKHARVRDLVRLIPSGSVASYGMIASLLPGVTARMVGFVMAGLKPGTDVPWQRVINASGGISPRPGSQRQRVRLEEEGIAFKENGKIDWKDYAWDGPDPLALDDLGIDLPFFMTASANWPTRNR